MERPCIVFASDVARANAEASGDAVICPTCIIVCVDLAPSTASSSCSESNSEPDESVARKTLAREGQSEPVASQSQRAGERNPNKTDRKGRYKTCDHTLRYEGDGGDVDG